MAVNDKFKPTGRPSTEENARMVENRLSVIEAISPDLPDLVRLAKVLSKGVCVLNDKAMKHVMRVVYDNIRDPERLERILTELRDMYSIKPDIHAITYLIDRAAGKPREVSEVEATVEEKGIKIDI